MGSSVRWSRPDSAPRRSGLGENCLVGYGALRRGTDPSRMRGMTLAVRRSDCAPGITFSEVSCDAGPEVAPFEEMHPHASIAFVTHGGFGYRSSAGSAVLGPGAVLLGNAGSAYTC